jgi:hypothetical protein
MSSVMASEYPDFQNFYQKGRANGWRYRQGRELAGKLPDAKSAVGAGVPKVRPTARTCPVHAVLGSF